MTRQDYTQHRTKRTYSDRFKAELVAQCISGETSVASLATRHGMNQNVLHRWISEHMRCGKHDLALFEDSSDHAKDQIVPDSSNWLAVLPGHSQSSPARKAYSPAKPVLSGKNHQAEAVALELSNGTISINLIWPGTNCADLAKFIKELMA